MMTKVTFMLAERRAHPGARVAAAAATITGDDERRNPSGRERRGGERVVERATSVVVATAPWPWGGNTRARGATRCT